MPSVPMSSDKVPCAVLGATGTVGQKFVLLLENHPTFKIVALGASERSEGKLYRDAVSWKQESPCPERLWNLPVRSVRPADFEDVDVVFSALPSDTAETCERELASMGKKVFSNAGAHRMDSDVPILLPLVNGPHVELVRTQDSFKKSGGFIVTNSNCACVGLTTALNVLQKIAPITKVQVATLQAISGAGYPGIPSLDILSNVVPFIGGEEEKIETECQKILGTTSDTHDLTFHDMDVSAMVHRVPVIDGHIVSFSVMFDTELSRTDIVAEAVDLLSNYESEDPLVRLCPNAPQNVVEYREEDNRPQPRLDSWTGGGFTTVCGRARPCNLFHLKLVTLAHNTVIGAAGGSVLNAEYAHASGLC